LKKGALYYNSLLFNAAQSAFQTVDLLQPMVEGSPNPNKSDLSEKEIVAFVKKWTLKLGALDIGFTELKSHHKYSHIGRGGAYGNPVDLDHEFAIAFTVEMNHESLRYNPKGPVVMESAQQYLNAGQIAVQLAQFLRNLGFDARAHIDANYRLICPIVAQDAGLGVIGRMGLLMTPRFGPRVRIGVVTTNLKLPLGNKQPDFSVLHFCEVCKKCAHNCPSQAISFKSLKKTKQPKPWSINHEKCFTYWCKVGTDCGRCVSVCPYSHPNNALHNTTRWFISRNPINRVLALKLDDFFYGKKPKSQALKSWMLAEKN
jgi:ferredoxin